MSYEKIKSLLADKENFKVENGKVFLKDMFGDWCERQPNSLKVFNVRGIEFTMGDIEAAISGKAEPTFKSFVPEETQQKIREENHKQTIKEIEQIGDLVFPHPQPTEQFKVKAKVRSVKNAVPKIPQLTDNLIDTSKPKRTALRSAEIKIIRKMLEEKKSINSMAKALGTNRFAVQYIVKQIKAGKTLMHEK